MLAARTATEVTCDAGSWGPSGQMGSAVEPGGHQAAAVVVAEVRRVVLEGWIPYRGQDRRVGLGAIDHLGQIALDVEEQLTPLCRILNAPLASQHVSERGVVNLHVVAWALRQEGARQEAVRVEKRRRGASDDALVLAEGHRGDVGAVFSLVELASTPISFRSLATSCAPSTNAVSPKLWKSTTVEKPRA